MKPLRTRLDGINEDINSLVENATLSIQTCAISTQVEILTKRFNDDYDEIMFRFDELVADFQEISMDYIPISENVAAERETIIKDASTYHSLLHERAYTLKHEIEDKIDSFKLNISSKSNSQYLIQLEDNRDAVAALIKQISDYQIQVIDSAQNVNEFSKIILIRKAMHSKFEQHEAALKKISDQFRGKAK
jgi:hypothetical protein